MTLKLNTNLNAHRLNRLEVLAFADELVASPDLLSAWTETFGIEDAVRLMVLPGSLPPTEMRSRIEQALAEAEITDASPHLELLATEMSIDEQGALARRVARKLGTQTYPAPFDELLGVASDAVWTLRSRLPREATLSAGGPVLTATIDNRVSLRYRDTFSDKGVLHQVLSEQNYLVDRFQDAWPGLTRYTVPTDLLGGPPLIIDCGANIGVSSVYFALKYPHARVVAIEPEAQNFELLVSNTSPFPNIVPMQRAIAARPGNVLIHDPGRGGWAMCAGVEVGGGAVIGEIEALTVAQVVEQFPGTVPFLLKVDIEGAEGALFAENTDAMDAFPAVVLELHDRLFPGEALSQSFLRWHLEQGRDFQQHSENIWSFATGLAFD
jgi:FkbM family methyltransferase